MKSQPTQPNQTGYCHLLKLFNYLALCKKIKKNEGYRNVCYLDQLGYPTIGYGHLIKKNEKKFFKKKHSKQDLNKIFIHDLNNAIIDFKKNYNPNKIPNHIQEILIEMIFQLGIKNVLKFKKFNFHLRQKKYYLAALEMLDSRWYLQTPKRVEKHITTLLFHDK